MSNSEEDVDLDMEIIRTAMDTAFIENEEISFANDSDNLTIQGVLQSDDVLVASIWAAIGIFGVATNILIMVGIIHNRRMSQLTSYWFILSLSICDICMLLVYFILLLPSTTLHDEYMTEDSPGNAVGVFIYDAFWYTGVIHLMLMALNRYFNICHPKVYHQAFSPRNTVLYIFLALAAGTIVSVPGLFPCCRLVYNHNYYVAIYKPDTTLYSYADIGVNGASVIVLVYCYVRIVIKVRASRIAIATHGVHKNRHPHNHQQQTNAANGTLAKQAVTKTLVSHSSVKSVSGTPASSAAINVGAISRREMRLFFQFCSVSLIFLLTWSTWQWLPYMSDSKWVGFFITTLFFINNCNNPTIYLIFNSTLRREIMALCGCAGNKEKKRHSKKVSFHVAANEERGEGGLSRSEYLNRHIRKHSTRYASDNEASIGRSAFAPLLLSNCASNGRTGGSTETDEDNEEDSLSSSPSSGSSPMGKERESVFGQLMATQLSIFFVNNKQSDAETTAAVSDASQQEISTTTVSTTLLLSHQPEIECSDRRNKRHSVAGECVIYHNDDIDMIDNEERMSNTARSMTANSTPSKYFSIISEA